MYFHCGGGGIFAADGVLFWWPREYFCGCSGIFAVEEVFAAEIIFSENAFSHLFPFLEKF